MSEFYTLSQEQNTQKGKYLTFQLGKELFAIEISYVTEINNMISIVPLPDTPAYFKGIISLRGKIIPVIDMRMKLCKQAGTYNARTCIIILSVDGIRTGLIVDAVAEVRSIGQEEIEPLPKRKQSNYGNYFQGIGKVKDDLVLILDCKKILLEDEMLDLTQVTS